MIETASGSARDSATEGSPEWPARPWVLGGAFALAALAIYYLTDERMDVAWRAAAAVFVGFGCVAAGFTVERNRWREPLPFSGLVGVVMAGLTWRAVAGGNHYGGQEYGFAAGVLSVALALPLFQAGSHRTRFATPYSAVHSHVWTEAISAGGSLAFTGLSWLALVIVGELFDLLKIRFIKDLINDGWFAAAYSGLAFGAALGTIRNERRLLGTLRTIVVMVLSLLAVPFAAALVMFLIALAVSGPGVLWQATRNATPVLLACAAGAFVLANTVLREDDCEMSRSRVMRIAALVLALAILPLTAFAAVSLGLRIDQHGLSPERIWGMIAIVVALAYAVSYAAAAVRGRPRSGTAGDWRDRLRNTNLALAAGVCGLAFVLALPILDFGALATSNQVRRLESGRVSPQRFDYEALRWDFGSAGRRALARLAASSDTSISERARIPLAETARRYRSFDTPLRTADEYQLRVQPDDPVIRRAVLDYLRRSPDQCPKACVAVDLGADRIALVEGTGYYEILRVGSAGAIARDVEVAPAAPALRPDSRVEVRSVPTRYIFIDGQRIATAVPEPATPVESPVAPR